MNRRFQQLVIFTILLFQISAHGQSGDPELLDEFGNPNSEETEADLLMAKAELAKRPNSFLEFLIQRGQNQTLGEPYRTFGIQKTYLLLNKVDKGRIISTFCGDLSTTKTQVYLLDSLTQRHVCTPEIPKVETSTLFISSLAPNPRYELGTCCLVDNLGRAGTMEAVRAFAGLLAEHVNYSAYVVIYGGTNIYWTGDSRDRTIEVRHIDSPKYISELGESVRQVMLANRIDRSRIITLVGGYRDTYASIDLWIIPPGGKRPKPAPNYFPRSHRRSTYRHRAN